MSKKTIIANVVGGVAVVGLIVFPEPNNLTTWQEVGRQINEFIRNPYEIMLSVVAFYGYVTNLK